MIQDFKTQLIGKIHERREACVEALIRSGQNHDVLRGHIQGLDEAIVIADEAAELYEIGGQE